jgi:hypothetical protein
MDIKHQELCWRPDVFLFSIADRYMELLEGLCRCEVVCVSTQLCVAAF